MRIRNQAPGGRAPRLESLTGLRWFAAFAVFAFHVREFYPVPGMEEIALFGNSGVTFFFVLSGFVLAWSFSTSDTAPRFYWRRFARIWPALAVSTAVAIPVFYAWRGVPFDRTEQWGVVASLTLVQAWLPAVLFSGNPAAWSLSDEAFFYALFPAVVRPVLRSPGWVLALLALTLIGINAGVRWWAWGEQLTGDQQVWVFVSPLGRLSEFLLGLSVAAAIRRGWRCRLPVALAVALTAGAVAGLWHWQLHPDLLPGRPAEQAMNQVMAPVFALLIAAVASRDLTGRWMVLRSRPLVALGKWSYAFYLVHATVLYALVQRWLPRQEPSWENWRPIGVALGLGILAAVALYALVEHPIERGLRSLLSRWTRPRSRREETVVLPSVETTAELPVATR